MDIWEGEFQIEVMVSANALRQELIWYVQGLDMRLVGLKLSEQREKL